MQGLAGGFSLQVADTLAVASGGYAAEEADDQGNGDENDRLQDDLLSGQR